MKLGQDPEKVAEVNWALRTWGQEPEEIAGYHQVGVLHLCTLNGEVKSTEAKLPKRKK